MAEVIGSMSALITPFLNGKIDFVTYEKLIRRQIQYGMDAVVPVGTTGESATLSHDEHKECIEAAVQICKNSGVKVLAGAGSNSTKEAIDLSQFAQKMGADAILSVTPYYNKPSQEGLFEHYKAVAQSVDIPVMLYNVPGRTGISIEIETITRLAEIKNIYAIKEASGSMERTISIATSVPNIKILSGEDAINYPILAAGGVGVISVTGNLLPRLIAKLTKSAMSGEDKESRQINQTLYPINHTLFVESNPIPIKAAMFIAGLIPSLEYRLPLLKPNEGNYRLIEKIIKLYEVEL
ncbi:4-hydroxy-tetrahydrodipicolinate synthase [Helicobacter monodelphidis]|uniref:4-hydroxy-tetrahydrodipicolinate synthase n=1 Tax=Helicobacter sp. 15-1451 TaxID=2004995 RepID=UPI000DCD3EE5|nr:4-hydroxy-tetrahydrodipicolinate synthase [Helicobacter sp. 15-1451]RAX57397.1 4-hydroxy-tetrahydrodipicolinate synthase [Helicobacter sp. 15-1451]